jgi:Heparinase II/III N-terminus
VNRPPPSPTTEPMPAAGCGRVAPRPVFCPIRHLHTDAAVADDAVAGRFRHAGVLLELGNPPDWTRDPYPADEEWLIEFSKLYQGLDLAHAYGRTGDHRYLAAWQHLVGSWIDVVPVDRHSSDVLARRLQNWVYAWQQFAEAPGFPGLDPLLEQRILASIEEQADQLAGHLTAERNHRTLELYALLVVFLALPALDPDGARAADALRLLGENLLTDVWADGVHRERSTHYHLIALRSFVAARVNATRYGLALPAGYDERLAAGCRFGLHLHRPDGEIPAGSDSDGGSYRDLLLLAGQVLDDPELRWFGSAGAEGTPLPRAAQRLGGRRPGAFPAARRRAARRRRARPLRRARGRGVRPGPAAAGRPRPVHLRRAGTGLRRAELAAPVQGHRRAQHRAGRRPGPDALPAREAAGPGRVRPAARPAPR